MASRTIVGVLLAFSLGGCTRLLSISGDGAVAESNRDLQRRDATVDLPLADQPRIDLPRVDTPGGDAIAPDLAKPDAPKPDAAKPDAPKPDAPKPDAAKPDAPKPDAPKPDSPKPDLRPPDLLPPDLTPPFVPVVVPAYPGAATAFLGTMAYGPIYTLPDTPCSGSSCRHLGWMRKVVLPWSSCAEVHAIDLLGAFTWKCVLAGGKATLFSHLRPEKGLRELLTAAGWIPNKVKVTRLGADYFSALLPWWSDPILPLPDNSATIDPVSTLATAGAIYVLTTSRASTGYAIAADRIAVVTLGDAVVRHNGSTIQSAFLLSTGARSGLWIEVQAQGNNTAQSFLDLQLVGSQVRNTSVANFTGNGFRYLGAASGGKNRYLGLRLSNLGSSGFYTLNTNGDVFQRVFVASSSALIFAETAPFTATQITVVNSTSGVGHYEQSLATVHNAALINSGSGTWAPLYYQKGFGITEKNTASHVASLHNGTGTVGPSVTAEAGALSNKLTGVLVTSGPSPCAAPGGAGAGFLHTTCTTTGADGSSSYGTEVSNALLRTGRSAAASFFGGLTVDDPTNPNDASGLAPFASISEWQLMANPFRFWGKASAVSFPVEAQRGRCSTGTCQIWDYRLKASDTALLNRSFDGASPNPSFAHGDPCPAGLGGDRSLSDQSGRSYLAGAVELLEMGGDDDGLCESGETCLYTPNFGSYQGHGDLFSKSCLFQSNGGLSGITIFAYPLNGY